MGKNSKKIFSFILALTILFDVVVFAKKTFFKDDLININELSEEFMDNYFEEVSNVPKEDKENMLIITSKDELKDTYGASKIIEAPNHQYFLQYDSEEEKNNALEKFNSDNSNIDVSENLIRTIDEDTVLVSSYNSWGVEAMSLDTLLEKLENKELNNVVVAIIDTGLDVDLFNTYYPGRLAGTYNVLENSNEMYDNNGHGTHVAGTVAETTPSSVKILAVRTSDTGTFYTSDTIAAINYVTYGKKADVMNMSFGGYGYSQGEYNSIEAAKQEKIISVAAAGNDNKNEEHYPSAFDNTISISAIDKNRDKADFSNYGNSIMFATPGVSIKSIVRNDENDGDLDHAVWNGTSMATPHAVGAVANLKSMNKNITFNDTITLLRRYSDDIGDIGWDRYFGYGAIDFTDAELCDGSDCDEYNVFKASERDNLDALVDSYEIEPVLTAYNYGTITNVLGTKLKIRYTNNRLVEYPLYNIKNLEISGYDPYSSDEQTVHVKFKTSLGVEIDDSFVVTNPSTYESVWEYKLVENNNIELTNYKDSEFTGTTLYIPSTIDGYTVTGIADGDNSIFQENWDSFKNVQYLYLPSTLTKIGNNAFRHSSLQSGLRYVKSEAESISVGDYAFMGSQSLMELDAEMSYIGDGAFSMAISLHDIKFSNNITHIGERAFTGSLLHSKIVIPSTITELGDEAFYGSNAEEIVFMNNMEIIPENLMYDSNELKKVTLPEGVKEIGSNAFASCEKLESINLPESLTTIRTRAFSESFDGGILIIPRNVTSIEEKVFETSGLKEITFTNNIDAIPSQMFMNNEKLEKVTLPEGVIEIGDNAFYNCEKLTSINLPESLTSIGKFAFSNAFDPEVDATLTIPRKVTNFGNKVFYESGLNEVIFLSNVETLPESLFKDNHNLEKVTISEGVSTIDQSAFEGCEKLETIDLPESLTTIGVRAFAGSFDSEKGVVLEIPVNVNEIGIGAFSTSGLKEIKISGNIEAIPGGMIRSSKALEKVILPESVKEIGSNAFEGCDKLSLINLPEGLTTIGETAFYNAFDSDSESAIIVPKSITTIGYHAFYGVNEKENVKFYVYSNSVPKTYAHDNNINYVQIDPDVVSVQGVNSQYNAFDTVDMSNVSLELTYNEETTRTENITKNIEIEYPDSRENLRYGDTSVKLVAYNEAGYKIEKNVSIEVLKLQPEYTVPTGLSVNKGQKLSQIELPAGFEWMNGNQVINESGVYKARFVPTDSINYETVENIDITITVNENSTSPYVVNNYTVDENNGIISNITPNTELNSFISNIILGNGYGIDADSKEVNGKQVLYTGAKVRITHGLDLYKEYTVSVIGDINGDGDFKVGDIVKLYNYLFEGFPGECYKNAADYNKDGKNLVGDIIKMYNALFES